MASARSLKKWLALLDSARGWCSCRWDGKKHACFYYHSVYAEFAVTFANSHHVCRQFAIIKIECAPCKLSINPKLHSRGDLTRISTMRDWSRPPSAKTCRAGGRSASFEPGFKGAQLAAAGSTDSGVDAAREALSYSPVHFKKRFLYLLVVRHRPEVADVSEAIWESHLHRAAKQLMAHQGVVDLRSQGKKVTDILVRVRKSHLAAAWSAYHDRSAGAPTSAILPKRA